LLLIAARAAGLSQQLLRVSFVFDDAQSIQEEPDDPATLADLAGAGAAAHGVLLSRVGRWLIFHSLSTMRSVVMKSGATIALNLLIHVLAGLTLLCVVRRTLRQPRLRQRYGTTADELALAVAILWVVHPLADRVGNLRRAAWPNHSWDFSIC